MGWRGREDDLMMMLQRIPDERPLSEKVLNGKELMEAGDRDDAAWSIVWAERGYRRKQIMLLREAFDGIEEAWLIFWESGDPDRAFWRLVDAAGLLGEVFPGDRAEATGRGYRIEKVKGFCGRGHRWDQNEMLEAQSRRAEKGRE